jgi:dihydrofolate reductase
MKIIVAALQSLDGYLARSHQDDLSWASKEDRRFFKDFTTEIGTMLMGSTTFNNMKMIKGTAFRDRHTLVFTSKPEDYKDYQNIYGKVEFFKGSPVDAIKYLEQQGINQAVVVGGGKLIQQFLDAKLVNELYITLAPVIFAEGVKVCDGLVVDQKMQLLEYKNISQNEVLLHYQII